MREQMTRSNFALALAVTMTVLSGCSSMTHFDEHDAQISPAKMVAMPKKPTLSERTYVLQYQYPHESARVKSVQLPAHPITKGQAVVINSDKVSLTNRLKNRLVSILTEKQLVVIKDVKQADYVLTINQLDISEEADAEFSLANGEILNDPSLLEAYAMQTCKNISGSVNMKLTHTSSKDVVWFAKSSISTASFERNPLRYQLKITEYIDNAEEVAQFVSEQNSEQAIAARGDKAPPTAPSYQVRSEQTDLSKMSGSCDASEVSALVPELHYYLSGILLEKINVQ